MKVTACLQTYHILMAVYGRNDVKFSSTPSKKPPDTPGAFRMLSKLGNRRSVTVAESLVARFFDGLYLVQ